MGIETRNLRKAPSNPVAALILFGTVALAPLPFGSTDQTTIAFWCVALGLCAISLNPSFLRRQQVYLLIGIVIIIGSYAFVLHEQLARVPWFAPSHPLWTQVGQLLDAPLVPSASIARGQPFYSLGAPLAGMLSLTCSIVICADPQRARQLLNVIAWSGVAYAIYGVFALLVDPTRLLWREKEAYTTVLTATFVNRNTAAVYFGSCSVLWLLFLGRHVRDYLPRSEIDWKMASRRLLWRTPQPIVVSFSMLFVCLSAIFMTGSRAGVLFSLLSLVMAFALYFRRDLPKRTGIVTILFGGIIVSLALLQLMGGSVSARIDAQGLADIGRVETYRATLRMILDHPWWGTGQGTFVWAYPVYRSSDLSLWGTWDRAHNSLLEIASDMGLPIAAIVVFAWASTICILTCGIGTRHRNPIAPIAALSVAILALLHSMVDFSMQIPGFAIVTFAIVGAGLSQAVGGSSRA